MKEVINISLARISFAMETDAYKMLEAYIEELREHYGKQGREIVEDIEERIAELLIERGCRTGTVNVGHITEVIGILGRPGEFGTDDGDRERRTVKKKIYRDRRTGIVGGVCSGLGSYFNMDPVWIRVIFLAVTFLLTTPWGLRAGFLSMGWFPFMLLVYCILWLIIPEAKTFTQRCAMKGEAASFDSAARDSGYDGSLRRNETANTVGKVVIFALGVLLSLMGFFGFIFLALTFFGLGLATGLTPFNFVDMMHLDISNTLWLKLPGMLTLLLPCVGMLYVGLKFCLRFKSPKWRPGLVIFALWVVSLLSFLIMAGKSFNPYYNVTTYKDEVVLGHGLDTVYVRYPKLDGMQKARMKIDADDNSLELFYLNENLDGEKEIIRYPGLHVRREADSLEVCRVTMNVNAFTRPTIYDECVDKVSLGDVVTVKDSLITVYPRRYSKSEKFDGSLEEMTLYVPENTIVVLQDPVVHEFKKGVRRKRSGIR